MGVGVIREWVWNSRVKFCQIKWKQWKCSRVPLQGFDFVICFRLTTFTDPIGTGVKWLARHGGNVVVRIVSQQEC